VADRGDLSARGNGAKPSVRKSKKYNPRKGLTIAAFLSPAMILFLVLVLAPILLAMWASLYKWNGYGWPSNYVGFDNFKLLFQNPIFKKDLGRGLLIVVLSLLVQLPIALGLALLLNQKIRGRAVYRLLFFAPYVLSEVITAVLFSSVLSTNTGLLNLLLRKAGMHGLEQQWLANPDLVMYTVFIVITWKYFGFHMIILLAGRQSIPEELGEAAAIDGAGTWQTFRSVTLPLLGPTIRISVFLSVIGSIQLFDLVWVLTKGGPSNSSETMAVTMFQYGFIRHQLGYAMAISIAMFFISLLFALIYQRTVLRRDLEGAVTVMGGGN
jgi:raffinose/stachyose/melibiose transport system permease protein